jgi:hypothetical protein
MITTDPCCCNRNERAAHALKDLDHNRIYPRCGGVLSSSPPVDASISLEIDSRSFFVNDLLVFGFPSLKFQGAVLPAKFL